MKNLSRRSFLRGALTVAAVSVLPALPKALAGIPTLYGDGVHDDTDALNALFSGERVLCEGNIIRHGENGEIVMKGGSYLISQTVFVSVSNISVTEAAFTAAPGFKMDYMMKVSDEVTGEISNCYFDARGVQPIRFGIVAPAGSTTVDGEALF